MQKPVVSGWNKPTVEYYEVTQARVVKAPARLRFFGSCGLVAALIGWQGYRTTTAHNRLKSIAWTFIATK